MRMLFLLIVLLLVALTAWFGIRHTDDIYNRLRLNKATYDFGLQREREAIDQALAIVERSPSYRPALEAAIGWIAARQEFERAVALAATYGSTMSLAPPARYALALCSYELGREAQATALLASIDLAARKARDLPAPLIRTYLAIAQGDLEEALRSLESANSHFAGDRFYHSLYGRACYARDDIARATDELERSLALGGRNPRSRLILAVCHALQDDTPAMTYHLDQLAGEGIGAYTLARREIEGWLGRLQALRTYVSPTQSRLRRERVLNLRRALIAIEISQGNFAQAQEALAALIREYPDQVGLPTRLGLLLESQCRFDEAARQYQTEAPRLLLPALKLAALDAPADAARELALWEQFLSTGSVVLDARVMEPTSGEVAERGWDLYAAGEFAASFVVPTTGRYAFDLLACGDPAGGLWPLVRIEVDDQPAATQYINAPVWDLFEFHRPLLAGRHTIRIVYLNNTVAPGTPGDRNFYLDKVIIRPEPN